MPISCDAHVISSVGTLHATRFGGSLSRTSASGSSPNTRDVLGGVSRRFGIAARAWKDHRHFLVGSVSRNFRALVGRPFGLPRTSRRRLCHSGPGGAVRTWPRLSSAFWGHVFGRRHTGGFARIVRERLPLGGGVGRRLAVLADGLALGVSPTRACSSPGSRRRSGGVRAVEEGIGRRSTSVRTLTPRRVSDISPSPCRRGKSARRRTGRAIRTFRSRK